MSRTIEVCLTPALLHLYAIENSIVVVIDILRATSSITYGLENGAHAIIPVAHVEDCLKYNDRGYLLAAERNGEVVVGYDFGNSPFSYTKEKVAGKTISEIFVDDGEQVFRKMEVEIVGKLLTDFTGVIALGGGAPITLETQQKLESSDFPIIFIDVSISQAANRVGFNKDRPLLLINPRQQWLNLMNDRRPIYERLASEIVSSDNKKPVEVAKIISEKLKSKL